MSTLHPSCSTLIRGASREEDVNMMAEITQLVAMDLQCHIWFEWVDSKANPSDGLSRVGPACPRFGARACAAIEPPWSALQQRLAACDP